MKQVKQNKEKIADLQNKIFQHCANLSFETPLYGSETKTKINEWLQSCTDLTQDNIKLLCSIAKTNLATSVTIEIGGKQVSKTIAEWVWRRREYAAIDRNTYSKLTDRGLKEGSAQTSPGTMTEIKLVRHFDPTIRDERLSMYQSEPHQIDSALEVTNAVTDLLV